MRIFQKQETAPSFGTKPGFFGGFFIERGVIMRRPQVQGLLPCAWFMPLRQACR